MKLTYFKRGVPNFGDELNTYMWQELLPEGLLDENADELFLGIGSIIFDTYPKEARKYVMGSGFAGYTTPPDLGDGSWDIIFVRGPRTAERLNLPADKAICDSAILLRAIDLPDPGPPIEVAFMPHYESLERGFWKEACGLAGIRLIDPTHDVDDILSQLRSTRLLITEAMHGAIVADALRVPWISALPINPIHRAKWQDWAGALSLDVRHHTLLPSSVLEAWVASTGGRGDPKGRAGRLGRSPLARPANRYFTHRAAEGLQALAREEPQLSLDPRIEDVTERALTALNRFVRDHSLEAAGTRHRQAS